jgi:hypothetical protein
MITMIISSPADITDIVFFHNSHLVIISYSLRPLLLISTAIHNITLSHFFRRSRTPFSIATPAPPPPSVARRFADALAFSHHYAAAPAATLMRCRHAAPGFTVLYRRRRYYVYVF